MRPDPRVPCVINTVECVAAKVCMCELPLYLKLKHSQNCYYESSWAFSAKSSTFTKDFHPSTEDLQLLLSWLLMECFIYMNS